MASQLPAARSFVDRENRGSRATHIGRMTHAAIGLVYLFFFLRVYRNYISVDWGYAGLIYRPLDVWELVFVSSGVLLISFAMPIRIDRPSTIFIWVLYAFVFVPTMAITFMLGEFAPSQYVLSLTALTAMMLLASVISQLSLKPLDQPAALPGGGFVFAVVSLLVVSAGALYVVFGDILSFASVDDVYFQRFAASEVGGGPIGYVRTHFAYALAPAALAMGLCAARRRWLIPLAFVAFVFSYMVDAAKIALLIPFAMIALHFVLTRARASMAILTGGLTFLAFVCSLLTSQLTIVRFLADLILLRSITVPAQTFQQYFDLFSQRGYTWWSNVSGIRLFVPPPGSFAHDTQWPMLGLIVGREYYANVMMNANANLFVGEGVAAAGALGVVVIGIILSVCLRALDVASRAWDSKFVLLVMTPLALCLSNVHLSTLILSFGGVFWALWFVFYDPRPKPSAQAAATREE